MVLPQQADESRMDFSLTLAYGAASVVTGMLALMSMRNRQSGWQRARSDEMTDLLIAWAYARHGGALPAPAPAVIRRSAPVEAAPAPAASSMESQLLALHSVLNQGTSRGPERTRETIRDSVSA